MLVLLSHILGAPSLPPSPLCPRVSQWAAVGPPHVGILVSEEGPGPDLQGSEDGAVDARSPAWCPWPLGAGLCAGCTGLSQAPGPPWRLPTAPIPCPWTAQQQPSGADTVPDPPCSPGLLWEFALWSRPHSRIVPRLVSRELTGLRAPGCAGMGGTKPQPTAQWPSPVGGAGGHSPVAASKACSKADPTG